MSWVVTDEGSSTLRKLLVVLPDADEDVLSMLIEDVTRSVLTFCHIEELPAALEPLVRRLVIARNNKLGSEGVASESFSGISQGFTVDLDADTKRELYAFRVAQSPGA